MECTIKSGTMHTAEATHEMHRVLACYYPDNRDEVYAGNEHIINNMGGIKITKHSDLDNFCEML